MAPLKGPRVKHLNNNIKRMLKMARKYKVNLAAIKMTPHLSAQLPAWYHLSAVQRPITSAMAKCLLQKHDVAKVTDLLKTSARLRHPAQHPTHRRNRNYTCLECASNRDLGCSNPHKCATEALTRLNLIPPKHNPRRQEPPDGMSLTRTRKQRNEWARENDGEITFDPALTCKESLAECFRIFTDPDRISTHMAQRYRHQGPIPRCKVITVYTDGACMNNGKKNARCRSGVWFGQDDPRNRALRIPGNAQSNQVGKIAAIIAALEIVPPYQLVKIYTDSKYVIEGLTTHLGTWEDDGWIDIKNTRLFRKAAHLMRHRSAKTTMQWVKGHDGNQGNEGSDALAKLGTSK
jgi:ribonuclease HI